MDNSPKSLTPSNAWMVAYVAYSEPEAYIVAGRLKSEGIDTFVHQEPVGSAYGIHIGKLGEVKVLVRPEDYDRALTILDEDEDDSADTDLVLDDDDLDE